ncbi:IS481 family transposase, partial [Candidatus Gracilibacteria bacterium]|nr:IS481 family transposase [Candidatus Gracilibacteria bacterium]
THLRELGVSGEFIDAFMGHWEFGQEPYGKYSSLSPLSYIETLKKPIEILLEMAGWLEIRGVYEGYF